MPGAVPTEVVTVEVPLQPGIALFLRHAIGLSQQRHTLIEVGVYLFLCHAAKGGIAIVERKVDEVVQVAEHAHLAKLGHTRKESEADIAVAGLENPIESLEDVAVFGL